jgi:hypothetical protein
MSRVRACLFLLAVGLLWGLATPVSADSPLCDQARRLVVEARRQLTTAEPDVESIRWTLTTARNL